MPSITRILPCLWFPGQAAEAAQFYTAIFPNSRVTATTHYAEAGHAVHGMQPGSVLTVAFELDGQPFTALNGPPLFHYTEALSLQVMCDTQDEIDHYWTRLGAGGDGAPGQCGWLKDRYGVSWQIAPRQIAQWMTGGEGTERMFAALMGMHKLDLAALQRAYDG